MQQSGGLLPVRAGPSRTLIFANGENANQSLMACHSAPTKVNMVDVAQLVSASDCGSEGRGFDSHHPPHKKQEISEDISCFYMFTDMVRLVYLWIFRMGVSMLLQCRKAQHLLSGRDTQFAVNVFVVVFQCIFGNPKDFCNLFGVLTG